ncbi:uncharacterized protein LOC125567906 [Nematostella vectensis]|uniref:uncharacterized protein LOC125567906 n=1 Tax=Nematostella vectensis TaxID=45351 RepID=UPI0020775FC7|nr:uncharacterized protein LOC125567906 [Nematostella vectensis]
MTNDTADTSSGASSAATNPNNITVVNRQPKPETKNNGLIIYGGPQIADLEDSLPELTEQTGDNAYTRLIRKLDKNFLPRKNKDYARFQFGNLIQADKESMAQYYTRIREVAQKCEFTDENEAIRDHLIKTMINAQLRLKTIRKNLTLTQIIDEPVIDEESSAQAAATERKLKEESESQRSGAKTKDETTSERQDQRWKHQSRNFGSRNKGKGRRQIRHVERESDTESSKTESDEDINRFLKHVNIRKTSTVPSSTKANKCRIWINGVKTTVEPDTGADANVMDEQHLKTLQNTQPEVQLMKTTLKLKTLTEDLPVIGEINVTIANETRSTVARIAIIGGTIDSLPLLGRETLEELGKVIFDVTGRLKQPNKHIHKVQTGNEQLDQIVNNHT